MNRFGFELELFCSDSAGKIHIPPEGVPTDGFPGLVELRTEVHKDIVSAWSELVKLHAELTNKHKEFSFVPKPFHIFEREQKGELRRRTHIKEQWDIQNLYGKPPRLLGNKSIASLQINVSSIASESYSRSCYEQNCKGTFHVPTSYNTLDIPKIVKTFDAEFAPEIKASGRQPGEYCMKGNRLEYRSLPSSSSLWNNYSYDTAFRIKRIVDTLNK